MTKEDKDLLVKDLCGRLPYGVKVVCVLDPDLGCCDLEMVDIKEDEVYISTHNPEYTNMYEPIENIRPYLFPLSSMTEEQRKAFVEYAGYAERNEDYGRHKETYYFDTVGYEDNFYPNHAAIDWLNKNNFDYRGLIPKGIALDATGLNIY
jgi:hypothetical protein